MPNMTARLAEYHISRRHMLSGAAIFGTAMGAASFAPAWAQACLPPFMALDKAMADYVKDKKVAGMMAAIGFEQKDADYYTHGHLAMNSDVAVDKDTLWRVYSMTKPVTGMAAMMLIEQGKMQLDQPISDFIPEFGEMRVLTNPKDSEDSVPAKTAITIRHLLTHTAGFGYSIIDTGILPKLYIANGITPGAISKTPIPGFKSAEPTPPAPEFAKRLAKLPLLAEPGTQWNYSIGLDLLGYIIELASGQEFSAFLQQHIFAPLGMNSSYFVVPQSETHRLADNYVIFNGIMLPIDPASNSIFTEQPAFAFGGAGLVCSAADYDRFLTMLVGKGAIGDTRIMSEATAMKAMSNLLPEGADTSGSWVAGSGFGAGGRVSLGGNDKIPAGSFGWSGAAGTVALANPIRKIRASAYTQYMPADAYSFQRDFARLVFEDL